jgi:uncharacterized repeat protein (TIGR02543 family)
MLLCAGLLLFAGCKDLFHPEGPEDPRTPEFTVTFDADGGSPANQYMLVRGGTSIGSSMPSTPTRSGYTFDGWYTEQNGGGSEFTGSTTVNNHITVYAKWISGSSGISNITYSSVSGGEWTLQSDGRRQSPPITDGGVTKARVSFTGGGAGVSITIELDVSSEAGYDWAFISNLDNASATYDSGFYPGSQISGSQSVTVTIPVPAPGSHFIDIGYRKDGSASSGSDCAWFKAGGTSGGESSMPDTSLQAALDWLDSNAVEGGSYTITLPNNETFAPRTLSYSGKTVNITLAGGTTERTVDLSSTGSLFTVGSGVTLTLGDNLTLRGRSDNTASLVTVNGGGTLTMNTGSKISGNSASFGGGVYVSGGTFTMSGGEISGNSAFSGGGVYVDSGTFTKQSGIIYGSDESDGGLQNSAYSGDNGHAVYVNSSPAKKRNATADAGTTLDSSASGSAGGWEDNDIPPGFSSISYSSVSGGTWTLQNDGRRQSPVTDNNSVTKARISFTSTGDNASITIELDVSSEANFDYAFIGGLDDASATYDSGFYPGSRISGEGSVTVTIPVPAPGSHFIDIGYRKDGSASSGSDCAWFKVIM